MEIENIREILLENNCPLTNEQELALKLHVALQTIQTLQDRLNEQEAQSIQKNPNTQLLEQHFSWQECCCDIEVSRRSDNRLENRESSVEKREQQFLELEQLADPTNIGVEVREPVLGGTSDNVRELIERGEKLSREGDSIREEVRKSQEKVRENLTNFRTATEQVVNRAISIAVTATSLEREDTRHISNLLPEDFIDIEATDVTSEPVDSQENILVGSSSSNKVKPKVRGSRVKKGKKSKKGFGKK